MSRKQSDQSGSWQSTQLGSQVGSEPWAQAGSGLLLSDPVGRNMVKGSVSSGSHHRELARLLALSEAHSTSIAILFANPCHQRLSVRKQVDALSFASWICPLIPVLTDQPWDREYRAHDPALC